MRPVLFAFLQRCLAGCSGGALQLLAQAHAQPALSGLPHPIDCSPGAPPRSRQATRWQGARA